MIKSKIRFALIGCGYIAQKRIIPAILNYPNCELIVIIDRTIDKKNKINEMFGIPLESSIEHAFKNYDFHAVYISTPTAVHFENIIFSAKNKKHILSEKSLVCSYSEALKVVEICKKNKVFLFEGFMYQFHNSIKKLSKIIKDGLLGKINHIYCSFGFPGFEKTNYRNFKSLGGGVILDAACYTLHASRLISNSNPNSINSEIIYNNDGLDISGSSLIVFENNIHAFLSFSFDSFYRNNISVFGTDGMASLDRAFTSTTDLETNINLKSNKSDINKIKIPSCDHFLFQLDFFIKSLNKENNRFEFYEEILAQSKYLEKIRNEHT
jgi:dTDP-3,4-didehydro-2,6-dideoxy-alpha-D-glucose 3-reductase